MSCSIHINLINSNLILDNVLLGYLHTEFQNWVLYTTVQSHLDHWHGARKHFRLELSSLGLPLYCWPYHCIQLSYINSDLQYIDIHGVTQFHTVRTHFFTLTTDNSEDVISVRIRYFNASCKRMFRDKICNVCICLWMRNDFPFRKFISNVSNEWYCWAVLLLTLILSYQIYKNLLNEQILIDQVRETPGFFKTARIKMNMGTVVLTQAHMKLKRKHSQTGI